MILDRLRDELLANPRLRFGLAAIVALLVVYAILVLRDTGKNARATAAGPQARIAAIAISARDGDAWRAREQRSRGLLAEYDGYVWHDATTAQAQAAMQDLVTQKLARAGLKAREISVGGGIDAAPTAPRAPASGAGNDLVKIRARVVFEYQRPALAVFARGLIDDPRHVGVERLLLRTMPDPVVEVEVFALYRPPASPVR